MSEFIATGFKDPHRAAEVLTELQKRNFGWVDDLDQAVVVRNKGPNEIRVQFCLNLTKHEECAWARFWGSFLSLALFFPAAETLVDAAKALTAPNSARNGHDQSPRKALPDVRWWRETLCISDEFVRDVGGMIQPGDSALFMLLHAGEACSVLRDLRNYGGTPLHTTLSPEQDQILGEVLVAGAGN